ncbi:HEAT repeat domain-containing protein [Actinomycetota bacterium Odt1-20B]
MDGWETALTEATSPSWSRRARAGRRLAAQAEVPEVAEVLLRLLLDGEDTAVTRQTAEALARTGTAAAARLLARAMAEADDSQADWLQTGVEDAVAGPEPVEPEPVEPEPVEPEPVGPPPLD